MSEPKILSCFFFRIIAEIIFSWIRILGVLIKCINFSLGQSDDNTIINEPGNNFSHQKYYEKWFSQSTCTHLIGKANGWDNQKDIFPMKRSNKERK